MTRPQRKEELKSKIRCALVLVLLQASWIVPLCVHYNTHFVVKENVGDCVTEETETLVEEEVYIESVENNVVLAPEEQYAEVETESETQVSEESETEVQSEKPKTYYCKWLDVEFAQKEFELLCRTTYCEAGAESKKAQTMVCLVILNRYNSEFFPDSIKKVIYQEGQFSVVNRKDFKTVEWNEKTEEAVLRALEENKYPKNMLYFRAGRYHRWAKNYKKVGKTYFSLGKEN